MKTFLEKVAPALTWVATKFISFNITTIVAAKHILLKNLPILRLNETKVTDWREKENIIS